MWVESQDGEWLVNLEKTRNLRIERIVEKKAYMPTLVSCNVYADKTLLGEYPSMEQAKRVLKLIWQEAINFQQEPKHLMRMPKCMERKRNGPLNNNH